MEKRGIGQTWILAAAGALALVGGGVWMLARVKVPPPVIVGATKMAGERGVPVLPVGLRAWKEGGQDRVLEEEAVLRDPTPLFLPTGWNATESGLQEEMRREPDGQFHNYPARLTFAEADLGLTFPVVAPIPQRPADALALEKPQRPLGGFGEADPVAPELSRRQAVVEVSMTGSGVLMLTESLTNAQPPGDGTWQPLEFLVTVDVAGLVKSPMLIASSRVAAVDNYFQDFLGNGLHLGERLPPGFYRVAIGP